MGHLYDIVYEWYWGQGFHCQVSLRRLPPSEFETDLPDQPPGDSLDNLSDDSVVVWEDDEDLSNQELRTAVASMLEEVDVVLQRISYRTGPVYSRWVMAEWIEKFRCEETESVPIIYEEG